MTPLAAHLLDGVIPVVQTRQYALSLPPMLRPRLAYDHAAQKRVVGVFASALTGLDRLMLGSIAARVLRTAHIPVLTAR